ncbi:MAG: 23S rRNA (pseudouridine(1915)-N(3))-methyltransferase RlmH [bacterium]
MNATILCVGKLKERWQREGCDEYLKRLSRYGKYEIIAVDDLPAPERASDAQLRQIMDREGQALLKQIRPTDRVIALCVVADAPDSVALSRRLEGWSGDGRRNVFVIGGSNGLSDAVLARSDAKLSFSKLTFPHGLMRVILLEQLYRAERIRTGEPYHK